MLSKFCSFPEKLNRSLNRQNLAMKVSMKKRSVWLPLCKLKFYRVVLHIVIYIPMLLDTERVLLLLLFLPHSLWIREQHSFHVFLTSVLVDDRYSRSTLSCLNLKRRLFFFSPLKHMSPFFLTQLSPPFHTVEGGVTIKARRVTRILVRVIQHIIE